MQWDVEELQKRFNDEQRRIEIELNGMRRQKIPNDNKYERFYDERLGALYVYIPLETTDALNSPSRFLNELNEMYSKDPSDIGDEAFSKDRVIEGWKKELSKLITEFDKYAKREK